MEWARIVFKHNKSFAKIYIKTELACAVIHAYISPMHVLLSSKYSIKSYKEQNVL